MAYRPKLPAQRHLPLDSNMLRFCTPRFWLRLSVSALLSATLAGTAFAHVHHRKAEPVPHGFDGTYQIKITTTDGNSNCVRGSYDGTVTIQNFRIVGVSDPEATASGGIEDDGTVSLAFRKADQIANIGGQLKDRGGKGFWSSPTAQCGGLWQAVRQD
jgi:hypothetical protein